MTNPPNPWGSCFDSTAHIFLENSRQLAGAHVCHGIGIANRPGQEGTKIAHAWIEFDHEGKRCALDCIWLVAQPVEIYRRNLQASHVVEYDLEEFVRLWTLHSFPGPWDPEVSKYTAEALSRSAS